MEKNDWRERFRKSYREAYEGILPDSVLKTGNKWFEDFVEAEIAAAEKLGYRLGYEKALEDTHGPIAAPNNE
jgi:hypothetical protein